MGYIYTKSGKLAKRLYFGAVLLFEGLYYTFKNRVLADGGTFVENELPTISQDAKLVLTPNAYKAGNLYSAVPNDGTGDFIVERNSTATYIDEDGLIKTALANVPRIDFSSGEAVLLLEPQSTNLYLNSDVLANQNITTTASSYTVSFYGTGTITFSGSYSGSLVGTGAGIRVSKTFTATAGTLTSSISGTVTEGQAENLSFATSYIPSNGTTVTRLEDLVVDAGDSTTFNSEEGVLFVEMAALSNDSTNNYITISDGTSINRIILRYVNGDRINIYMTNDNGGLLSLNHYTDITETKKIAVKWSQDSVSFWDNGVKVGESLSFNTFSINTLNVIDFANYTYNLPMYAKIKQLKVFKTALTDQQLTDLTS